MSDAQEDEVLKRQSLRQIKKNLVQRRTQLFEQGVPLEEDPGEKTDQSQDTNANPVAVPQTEGKNEKTPREPPPKPRLPRSKPKIDNLGSQQSADNKLSREASPPSVANRAKLFSAGQEVKSAGQEVKPAGQEVKPAGQEVKQASIPQKPVAAAKPKSTASGIYAPDGADTTTAVSYAQVQKHIKKKLNPSKSADPNAAALYGQVKKESKSKQRAQSEIISHYDGVVVLPTVDENKEKHTGSPAKTKPTPPRKPPRTFAHDDYLEAKAKRKALKSHVKKCNTYEEIQEPLSTAYEEVEVKTSQDGVLYEDVAFTDAADKTKTAESDSLHLYEEVAAPQSPPNKTGVNKKLGSSRFPSSKLPPPPRPPPPKGGSHLDSPVVKVSKHIERLPPESFVGQRQISNPGYNRQNEVIPIQAFGAHNGGMKRCRSDEYLYVESRGISLDIYDSVPSENPIYQDPLDLVPPRETSTVTQHGVVLDADGYATPHEAAEHRKVSRKHSDVEPRKYQRHRFGTLGGRHGGAYPPSHILAANHRVRPTTVVSEKLSRAYSVLRLTQELQDASGSGASKDGASLACISEDADTDNEIDMEEHKKRLEYVCTVKLHLQATRKKRPRSLVGGRAQRLFSLALVVGLEKLDDSNQYVPKVIFRFPLTESTEESNSIAQFCFPDASQWRPVTHYTAETFSFVLTSSDGSIRHGYCRRLLPPGSGNRLPEVLCIISSLASWQFYGELLKKLEEKRREGLDQVTVLMQAAYGKPLPRPGMEAWIRALDRNGDPEVVCFRRPTDPRLEGVSHDVLFQYLKIDTLLKVFASVLLERRIIFVAQHLSTLSTCIHAIVSLLYPFSWQHTFVPVLPQSMLDVCCSPTPFIFGILTSCQPQVNELNLEEVLMVDLDHSSLLWNQGDESRIIPKKLQKALTSALKEDFGREIDTREARNLLITEAFLRLFVETVGHYTEFISTQQDGLKIFQKDLFVRAVSTKSIRLFLEWFTETQMFEVFMTDKLENADSFEGLFEARILEYREEMLKMNPTVKQNVKEMGKKMQSFFVDVGGKLKKAFGRSVFV